jgi:hypothetical protein
LQGRNTRSGAPVTQSQPSTSRRMARRSLGSRLLATELGPVTDDDFAQLDQAERAFAMRWIRMDEKEREAFCRQLLAAIEVLQRLGTLDAPDPGEGAAAA